MLHVPYKGNAAAQSDVLSGRININFDGASTVIPHAKEGRVRALGVTTAKRSPAFPEIPTLAEQGVTGYEYLNFFGLYVPAATPRDVVQRLHQALRAAQSSEAVRDRFRRDGAEAGNLTPEEFDAFIRDNTKSIARVARELQIKVE